MAAQFLDEWDAPPNFSERERERREATLDHFSAFVLAHATVTEALAEWRARLGLGRAPVEARLLAPVAASRDPGAVAALALAPGESLMLRKVALYQAGSRLAVACNFYAPTRLPADIAAALLEGGIPFGALLGPSGARRQHLGSQLEATSLVHRALVLRGDGTPVALVEERFLPAVLEARAQPPFSSPA